MIRVKAYNLIPDPAFAVYDEHGGQGHPAVKKIITNNLPVVSHDRIIDFMLFFEVVKESVGSPARIIGGDPQNDKTLFRIFFLYLDQERDRHPAWRTPCGPKIQENHLAFMLRQGLHPACQVLEGKVRRYGIGPDIFLTPETKKEKAEYGYC